MLDSITIDHGRKARPTVGRCADCRREGVVTPTHLTWGGRYLCELHKMDREAEYEDREQRQKKI